MSVYQKLAHHLDDLPGGFPSTESGVELRILHRLFSPEEAELALRLTLIPEGAHVIARRARLSPEETARRLEEMARKGLIYSLESEGRPPQYMATHFAIGIWEFHVNDLDPELIRDVNEYLPDLVEHGRKVPQLRTIPVEQSISTELTVLPYEKAEELVRAQNKLLVAPCICRRERSIMGEGCDKPQEACLVFGDAADYYRRNGLGRIIDQQEALAILKQADAAGLVLQPGNAKQAGNICCCCGCCCGVLRNLNRYPEPASLVSAPFVATINPDTCEGCGVCVDRCQMEALSLEDDTASLNVDRCIGCGLCVTTCPTDSLALARKPESEQRDVPKDLLGTFLEMGRARGKLGVASLVKMQIKSKVDRFLAPN